MIHVNNITIELSQVLDTGEEQTLIIEHDGKTPIISTQAWTQGSSTIPDMIEIADNAHTYIMSELAVYQGALE